jgi:hypothetical protein
MWRSLRIEFAWKKFAHAFVATFIVGRLSVGAYQYLNMDRGNQGFELSVSREILFLVIVLAVSLIYGFRGSTFVKGIAAPEKKEKQ